MYDSSGYQYSKPAGLQFGGDKRKLAAMRTHDKEITPENLPRLFRGRGGLHIPDPAFYLNANNLEQADGVLSFFRDLCAINGLPCGTAPHEDCYELPPEDGMESGTAIYLWTSFRGFGRDELIARQTKLEDFRGRKAEMDAEASASRLKPNDKAAILAQLATAVPDAGGIRGVEAYGLFPPRELRAAAWLLVHHTHHLPNEQKAAGLPSKLMNLPAYPYKGPEESEHTYAFENGVPIRTLVCGNPEIEYPSIYKAVHQRLRNLLVVSN